VTTRPPHPAAAAAQSWHLAGSLVALKAAVDAHWPKRDKRSDGGKASPEHEARSPGASSDHNPWLNNTVRAYDFDTDGIDAAWFAEQLRILGAHGDRRLAGGPTTDDNGYVIYNHHITAPDFSRWVPYDGPNPHVVEVHVSVTRDPAGYEDARPWEFLAVAPLHPVAPRSSSTPAHAAEDRHGPHPGNTAAEAPYPDSDAHPAEPDFPPPGHDARGNGADFRAQWGNQGPRVKELQDGLNRTFPRYAHLVIDGVYGAETAAVLEDFAKRIAENDPQCPDDDRHGLATADGNTVGPRIARALQRVGVHL
jgi:hypothetical protein